MSRYKPSFSNVLTVEELIENLKGLPGNFVVRLYYEELSEIGSTEPFVDVTGAFVFDEGEVGLKIEK